MGAPWEDDCDGDDCGDGGGDGDGDDDGDGDGDGDGDVSIACNHTLTLVSSLSKDVFSCKFK